MATLFSKAATGTLILGLALAVGACGRSETAANNSATSLNAVSGTGNDASAMDTMGNMGAPIGDVPTTNTGTTTTNTSGSSTLGNDSGSSAAGDAGAPGGDTGGNVQSNVSGM